MLSTPDALIAAVAATQYGAFTRRQAIEAGLTDKMITLRIRRGRWVVAAPGVYAFADHEPSYRRSLSIARLDAGPDAVISHESAATLHGFRHAPPSRFAVTVPHGRHHRNTIATVHQTTRPPRAVLVDGLPVTTSARTVVDLAKITGPRRLGRLLDDAIADRRVSLERVRSTWLSLAVPGRVGMAMLGDLLAERGESYVPPASELERALDAVVARVRAEAPIRQFDIAGWGERLQRVDRLYVVEKVILEGDGRTWHARVADFARDRRRDRLAVRKGYQPLRYAYEELTGDVEEIVEELDDILAQRRAAVANDSSVLSTT